MWVIEDININVTRLWSVNTASSNTPINVKENLTVGKWFNNTVCLQRAWNRGNILLLESVTKYNQME